MVSSFAKDWVRSYDTRGGVATLASTTDSPTMGNNNYSNSIFNTLKKYGNDPYLGQLIANGQKKYHSISSNVIRRHQIERYVLMGDPSLMIYGYQGDRTPYWNAPMQDQDDDSDEEKQNSRNIITVTPTVVDNGVNLTLPEQQQAVVYVYGANGVLIDQFTDMTDGEFIDMSCLPNGYYLIAVVVNSTIYREKIFVQH